MVVVNIPIKDGDILSMITSYYDIVIVYKWLEKNGT